ncbi:MAG TPA: radical SAM family heme chaperone HemW [bacterium]|uniref:Heme chaperone HemW n=1 Tax=candidate division TA06 bacterium ADurb.Bin417 TaxID=1852828 RepID=A0A1V5MI77_UNCT6|nr:MAG: Oxygen-independent coproporphyrinogen-III oxidase 1 [candidate division TA06 bacterium ADurb.Bin417]HNQ34757.1 radical SAM family heme chaperone HemW [bacterium]HNS48479.1 radical SAM family heme chaperone HemW [bacterium]
MKNSRRRRSGLYIQVPFCRSRCPYCHFYSTTDLDLIPAWLEAVRIEAARYQGRFSVFDTLYLGGGTPSVLEAADLHRLVEGVRAVFFFASGAEWTIEVNPDDLTPGKLKTYRRLGFNRISLGLQSFHDRELRLLGRRYGAETARRSFRMARESGFENINLDLICAFRGQCLKDWRLTLKETVELQPEHVSTYLLETDLSWNRPGISPLGESEQESFYLEAAERLANSGYLHYEVSNFARKRGWRSRHNLKYWNGVDYLGLGPDAHSFQSGRRWWNAADLPAYCRHLRLGRDPVAGLEELTSEERRRENIYLGLRTSRGLSLAGLPGVPEEILSGGLATIARGRLCLTERGFLLAEFVSGLLWDRLPLAGNPRQPAGFQ